MAKKNTFAKEADRITNKYKRRLGDDFTKNDVLARKGMELELNELKDKQEAVKAEQSAGATHVMPDGTVMSGATHQEAVDQGLVEYQNGGTVDPEELEQVKNYWREADPRYLNKIQQGSYELRPGGKQYEGTPYSIPNFPITGRGVGAGIGQEFYNAPYNQTAGVHSTASPAFIQGIDELVRENQLKAQAISEQEFNKNPRQFINGGKLPKYHKGGGIHIHNDSNQYLPDYLQENLGQDFSSISNFQFANVPEVNYGYNRVAGSDPKINRLDPVDITLPITESNLNLRPVNAAQANLEGQPQSEYYNPTLGGTSLIPLAASVAGNVLLSSQAGKNIKDVSYDRIRPETIDLSSERVAARSRANQLRNVSRRTAKGVGSNAADFTNRVISGEVAASRLEGEQISRSLTQEQTTNAQIANRAAIINANIGIRESEANRAEQNYAQAQKDQAIQNIIGDIGTYFGDVQKAKTYNQLYQQLPGTTSLYNDPNQKWWDTAAFGRKSTIAQDPTKTQRYQ